MFGLYGELGAAVDGLDVLTNEVCDIRSLSCLQSYHFLHSIIAHFNIQDLVLILTRDLPRGDDFSEWVRKNDFLQEKQISLVNQSQSYYHREILLELRCECPSCHH